MIVTGSQIPANTFIAATPGSISTSGSLTTITLTQSIGGTASSGPYTFVGSPDSYVVQTLVNNWYAWADYYVSQLASGPNAAPGGTFMANTTPYTNVYTIGSTDLKALTLTNIPSTFDMNQLRVGDVVTAATAGILNPNPTGSPAGTPGTPGYDPSLNYTIVSFDPLARTVELSLPVAVKTGATERNVHVRSPPVCRTVERRPGRGPHCRSPASILPPASRTPLPPGVFPDSLTAKRRSRSAA